MQNLNDLRQQQGDMPGINTASVAPIQAKKKTSRVQVVLYIIYLLGLAVFAMYNNYKSNLAEERFIAAYEEALKEDREAAGAATEEGRSRRITTNPFGLAPVTQPNARVASTEMLRQAAAGGRQQQAEEGEVLDYGAQVAAYNAQLKAQEDVQIERERREQQRKDAIERQAAQRQAQQDAYMRQAEAAQQAAQQQAQQRLQTSQGITSGASSAVGSHTTFQPKAVESKSTETSTTQQETQLNRLETRRIYNN